MNPKATRSEGYKGSYAGTIGGCPAARNLDKILIELGDEKSFRWIVSFIGNWQLDIKRLMDIKDRGFRMHIMNMCQNERIKQIKEKELLLIVETHLLNTVNAIKMIANEKEKVPLQIKSSTFQMPGPEWPSGI